MVITALAITILFSLPRLAIFRHMKYSLNMDFRFYEFMARSLYSYIIAIAFLALNLCSRKLIWGPIVYDPANHYHKVIYNIMLLAVFYIVLVPLHLALFEPYLRERLFRFFFNLHLFLEFMLTVLISHIYRLVFYNHQIKLANEALLKVNAETRYEVLMNQVNPHFLFNSFNTINALINSNKEEAVNFVNNLSDVYRYVLESSKKNLVTVAEEMDFVHIYVKMLKARYGNKLNVDFEIADHAYDLLIPPLAIQILIENAAKHNVISAKLPLTISVFMPDEHTLTVANPIQEKLMRQPSTGIGLSNLDERYAHLSDRSIVICKKHQQFMVTIPLLKNME